MVLRGIYTLAKTGSMAKNIPIKHITLFTCLGRINRNPCRVDQVGLSNFRV